MLDRSACQPRVYAAEINRIQLRFVLMDEPNATVWVVFADALALVRYPRALRRNILRKAVSEYPGDHRIIELEGRSTFLIAPEIGRGLVMLEAEFGNVPFYLSDVFEVVFGYARDQLLALDPPAYADPANELFAGLGK